jgi:hypothetical protein
MYACMHAHMHVCTYACMHTCTCIYMCMYTCIHARARVHVHMYTRMYICMYVCRHAPAEIILGGASLDYTFGKIVYVYREVPGRRGCCTACVRLRTASCVTPRLGTCRGTCSPLRPPSTGHQHERGHTPHYSDRGPTLYLGRCGAVLRVACWKAPTALHESFEPGQLVGQGGWGDMAVTSARSHEGLLAGLPLSRLRDAA